MVLAIVLVAFCPNFLFFVVEDWELTFVFIIDNPPHFLPSWNGYR